MPKGGGKRANENGGALENLVRTVRHRSLPEYKHKAEFEQAERKGLPARYMRRNYPHPTFWGTSGRRELYIHNDGHEILVECKYQDVSGTTHEKLPYMLEAALASPIRHSVFVFLGPFFEGGYSSQQKAEETRRRKLGIVRKGKRKPPNQCGVKAVERLRRMIAERCPPDRRIDVIVGEAEWDAWVDDQFGGRGAAAA
jgi:hypothetical protein